VTYDLGTPGKAWRSLYVSNNTIYIGGKALTVADNGAVLVDGTDITSGISGGGGGITYPTPSISYTGIFGGIPEFWRYTANPPKLQYSSNGAFKTTGSDLYWLDQNFDDGYYDLSGLTSITFTNIGGIKGYLDFSAKSEVVLTSIDLGDIAVIDEWYNFAGFSNTLTTYTASNLVDVGGGFTIYGNAFTNGPTMAFPALDRVTGDLYVDWNWNNMWNTPAPSFPVLRKANSLYLYSNKYTTWSDFPLLETTYNIQFHDNTNNENVAFACPAFPALTTLTGQLNIHNNDYMDSIPDFPLLTRIAQDIYIYSNAQLTAFPAFPALTYFANLYCADNPSMTTVGANFMPNLLWMDGEPNFRGCSLDQTSVDAILVKLASLDGTNGTTAYQYRNVYLDQGSNAIPSEAGLAAKATLESRNCNVYVNS
jgi:hypothetical protein